MNREVSIMPKPKTTADLLTSGERLDGVQVVPREYAGKWVAWSPDGRKIIAVAGTFAACESAAARAGFPAGRVAIDRVPTGRQRLTGSGM
jgi:hypothetical protein